jgi:zinc transport system substrate-binding protein
MIQIGNILRRNRALAASLTAAALAAALLLGGCGQRNATTPPNSADAESTGDAGVSTAETPEEPIRKLAVYASFYPLYDFAVKIGGERVSVVNMVPAGTEPHDWEPTASDIAGLGSADVFIYNGAGMEHWAQDVLESLQTDTLIAVEASLGFELIEGGHDHDHDDHDDGDDHDDHDDEGGYDPHVWLDPAGAKTEMKNIMDAFARADPDGAGYYEENYTYYAGELDKLDREFSETLGALPGRDVIVAHEAFGYLCKAYGLNQTPIEGLSPDSEPDPARMAEIIEFASEHDIKVVFFEELVSPKVAETIAEAIGAETDVLSPIEGLSDEDIEAGADYFTVMRRNLDSLKKALS